MSYKKRKLYFMKRKRVFWAVIIISVSFLSGCNGLGSVADLATAPQGTAEMKELNLTLKNLIGDMVLRYPISGDNRNAINLVDLTGSGAQDIVVTAVPSAPADGLHLYIITKGAGGYELFKDIPCSGTDVESIDFMDLTGGKSLEIVLGTRLLNSENKLLAIYSLADENAVFEKAYTTMTAGTHPKDEIPMLFCTLLNREKTTAEGYLVFNKYGEIKDHASCSLNSAVSSYGPVIFSVLAEKNSTPAFFINEHLSESIISVEIVSFNGSELINHTMDTNGNMLFEDFLARTSTIYSQDINNDGTVETPRPTGITSLPGTPADPKRLIEWYVFNGKSFDHSSYTVINMPGRYYIKFPENWADNIRFRSDVAESALVFYYIEKEGFAEDLFIIDCFDEKQWNSVKNEGWTLIKSYSDRKYAVKFYPAENAKIKITLEELRERFVTATIMQR